MIRYRRAAVDYHRIFYREAGDPQHSTSTEPPLRLQLGTDSLARVEAKLGEVASEMAAWRTLAESTDYEQTGRRYRQFD